MISKWIQRKIRRIVNWAYGYDVLLHLHFLDERQRNLSIILYDHIKTTSTGETVKFTDVAIFPADNQ